tara:strand:+ start:2833 stop:4050 length:1218 start_codon:yes stop_codon:yes gene_type:complete
MKKTFVITCCVAVLIVPFAGQARTPVPIFDSEAYAAADVREAFTLTSQVTADEILVPTVVEVPLATHIGRTTFGVYEENTDSFIPYRYQVETIQQPAILTVQANASEPAQYLIDEDYDTSVHFALPQSGEGSAQIELDSVNTVTSSGIVLSLAQNVARPTYVAVYATDAQGIESTVVAKKRLNSNTIRFPETTASKWSIVLEYAQPLRVTEVKLLQDTVEKSTQRSVRFLAQPQYAYTIYINPDRPIRIPTGEAGDLRDDEGVQLLGVTPTSPNPHYVIADSDADGVADIVDNCVSIANEAQTDVDGNGRGDVCDDYDRDGRINSEDNCPDDPNKYQADEDGDGIGDVCDDEESRLTEQYAWVPWVGLGFAGLVIASMFAIVLRRPEEEVLGEAEDEQEHTHVNQ